MKQVFSLQQLNLKRSIRLNRVLGSISSIRLKMNHSKSSTPSILILPDLRAPLDAEEMSRITIEDEYTLIIVDVPSRRKK